MPSKRVGCCPSDREAMDSLITWTHVIYALQAASFFGGVTFVIAVILNYVKRSAVKGTWLESHFRWQIRTFWYSVLWLIAVVTSIFLMFVIMANPVHTNPAAGLGLLIFMSCASGIIAVLTYTIWFIFRIVKGFARLE